MCGITGILHAAPDQGNQRNNIVNMTSTLSHRGPDGWGIYLSEHIALGHTRLSIIDLNSGDQPMMSNRYVLSYNGEIYNYRELRQEIESSHGIQFTTTSDTEVVLKSFEVYGSNALKKFNGQFALLLWDREKKELLIARDRYGIRPLYVLAHNQNYYFSSELKAFDTIPGCQRTFDIANLLVHGLLWNTLADSTVYRNIRSLPAGTFEVYQKNLPPRPFRYYEIGESEGSSPDNIESAAEEFSALLDDSVKLRLRSDVPVATYLSGGIDSAITTYLTAQHNKEKFKTFSVSFTDKNFDESSFQQQMVTRLNSEHFDLRVDYRMINDNFLDAVYHFERPVFRTAPLPMFLLSKMVQSEGIKVVLTGEGADEILFGYDSFKELKLLDFWSKQPDSRLRPQLIKKLYPHLQHYTDPKKFGLMRMYYEDFLNDYNNELTGLNIRVHNNKALTNYFNKDYSITFNKEKFIEKISSTLPDNFHNWTLLQKNQFLELKTLLSGYLLSAQGDRMSMAHSVEGRYPFLDHRLIERLFYFQDKFKLNGLKQKYILGKAYSDVIPASIINRPKRPYMAPDLKSFFSHGKLTEQASYFLSAEKIKSYGIFDSNVVSRLINKFKRKIPNEIGYRDNMIFTFVLSCQMADYWARNPKKTPIDNKLKKVEITDYKPRQNHV
ncbi:MAG: asparagine synthase (glutamine-hydrolyzing) [Candidatus Electrothrix sp. AUS4]|nr:asparagine synthase (glutamine-hydrolyzing) [Candidatus Electrothrix sp. AUS4]